MFYRPQIRNLAFRILQIDQKWKKDNELIILTPSAKFHVNIITDSGVMNFYLYEEIRNFAQYLKTVTS